jgi:hypothetical protein
MTTGAKCPGHRRNGNRCGHPAGYGTPHRGEGCCKHHGGCTPSHCQRYAKIHNERYRELYGQFINDPDPLNMLPELAGGRAIFVDFIERYGEVTAALVAWHQSFLSSRWGYEKAADNFRFAVQSHDPVKLIKAMDVLQELEAANPESAKPRQMLNISDARNTLLVIARIVETIEKIKGNVTRPDLLRILSSMGLAVERHVQQIAQRLCASVTVDGAAESIAKIVEEERAAIESDWKRIQLA